MTLKMRLYLGFVSATILAACGGGGDGGMQQNPTPTKLAFTGQPSNAAAGVAISPAVTVAVQDASSNVVSGATNSVTMALGNNPGGATLGGSLITNAVNGVASFSDLTVSAASTGYTLTASATGLAGATSGAFNVTIPPGPPTQMTVNGGNGQIAQVNTTVSVPPSVLVRDANGIRVGGVPITFAVTGGGGVVNPTTSVNTLPNGVASVISWRLGPNPGANELTATAAVALTGSPLTFSATGTAAPSGVTVTVSNNLFTPQNVTISAGQTVTWQWANTAGVAHDVTTSSGSPTVPTSPSPTVASPFTFGPVTFTTPGVYTYYCTQHASPTTPPTPGVMVGTVTVN